MLLGEFEIPYLEKDTANEYVRGMYELSSFISGQARLAAYNENEGEDISAVMIGQGSYRDYSVSLFAQHDETNALGIDYAVTTKKIGTKKLNCDKTTTCEEYFSDWDCCYHNYKTKSHLNQSGFSKILFQALKKGVTDKNQRYSGLMLSVEKNGYSKSKCEFDQLCLTSTDYSSTVAFKPEEDGLNVKLYAEPGTSDKNAKLIMSALEFADLNNLDVIYHHKPLKDAFDTHGFTTFSYGTHKAIEKTKSWFSSTAKTINGWLRK